MTNEEKLGADLKAALEKIETLEATVATHVATSTKNVETIVEQADLIAKLEAKIESTDKSAKVTAELPTIKVGSEKYQVAYPKFNLDGKDYGIEDLKSDKELCARLIEMESGVLVKVSK
jgi:hypothetical protein